MSDYKRFMSENVSAEEAETVAANPNEGGSSDDYRSAETTTYIKMNDEYYANQILIESFTDQSA